MPSTAMMFDKGATRDKLFVAEANLRIGIRYLRTLLDMYKGDVRLALLAYNRGEDAVWRDVRAGVNPGNGYDRMVMRGLQGERDHSVDRWTGGPVRPVTGHRDNSAARKERVDSADLAVHPFFFAAVAVSRSTRWPRLSRSRSTGRRAIVFALRVPTTSDCPGKMIARRGRSIFISADVDVWYFFAMRPERLARLHDVQHTRPRRSSSARSPGPARWSRPPPRRPSGPAPSDRARGCRSSGA